MWTVFDIFDPYVVEWTFGYPPYMFTWFMNTQSTNLYIYVSKHVIIRHFIQKHHTTLGLSIKSILVNINQNLIVLTLKKTENFFRSPYA